MFNYILTENNLTLFITGEKKPRIIPNNDKAKQIVNLISVYNTCMEYEPYAAIRIKEDIFNLLSPAKLIQHKTDNRFLYKEETNELYLEGKEQFPINEYLAKRILSFIEQNLPVEPLINFWLNCLDNPEPRAVSELFEFLEAHHYPISSEGNFIGYKKVTSLENTKGHEEFAGWYEDDRGLVRNNKKQFANKEMSEKYRQFLKEQNPVFVDSHSRSIKQSIGDVISMPREQCDFNRNNLCSTGYHIGSWEYAKNFSGDVFIYCEVNPKNVTSVPKEYGNGKLRCCEYKILGIAEYEELDMEYVETVNTSSLFDRDNN